ncbi:putative protein isoform X2 [Capsicum annuum]|nr:uncharacterized protein LOC107866089 isoform X2 [Capsicum annuum]
MGHLSIFRIRFKILSLSNTEREDDTSQRSPSLSILFSQTPPSPFSCSCVVVTISITIFELKSLDSMAPWKRRSTIVVIPKNTRRRISKQRQIKKEKKESTRLEQFIGEDGSTRLEKSIEEEGSTRLEKSTEEKYEETSGADASSTNIDASNDKFKSNENAQGENRGFEDEQRTKYRHDTPILEEDTSHAVESFPASPSPDTSLIKPIR